MGAKVVDLLRATVNPGHVTVHQFDGFIFLCGGALSRAGEPFASARGYTMSRVGESRVIAGRRVLLAEKLTTLLQGDDYQDLLDFEKHVAALCACVLIFVESPGSIAELGSFSVMPDLASKLLVVCEQRFESAPPSFIFLGPIASLRRQRSASVQVFPIYDTSSATPTVSTELLDDCWEYIEDAVADSLQRVVSESTLLTSDLSHQMVLVASLIDLMVASKLGEIEEGLNIFGIELKDRSLRKILRVLEQFGFIVAIHYGNELFYHSKLEHSLVTFRPTDSSKIKVFDRIRFKSEILECYSESDPRRFKAIKAFRRASANAN